MWFGKLGNLSKDILSSSVSVLATQNPIHYETKMMKIILKSTLPEMEMIKIMKTSAKFPYRKKWAAI